MMNRFLSFQQFRTLLFLPSLFALHLAATGVASANGTVPVCPIPPDGNTPIPKDTNSKSIDIKDTNYPIPSGAYFVSPNGKDTNSGKDCASPWPVDTALAKAPSGSTIVFRGGTYRNIEAKLAKELTLQAYPHEKAWIKGSVEVTGWVAEGGIWRKDGWNYSFDSDIDEIYVDPNYPMAAHHDMVYIDGVSLKQVASKAEVVPGTFYVDAANKRLYIGDNPAGKTVEATAYKQALAMIKAGSSNPSDTVVRGLGFAHYADQAIVVGAPRVKLENNIFAWNGALGVNFLGESGGTKGVSSNAIVRGNTFSYNGRKGFGGGRVHHILVEGNTISYNNVENFSKTWDAAGVKIGKTDGAILRNNIVENNFAIGIWFDESSTNGKIVNNTSRDNQSMGIMLELSHKNTIESNEVNNNTAGIMVADSSSAYIYNNMLSKNYKHIVVKDSSRKNTDTAEIAAGIEWITRDNVIENNIFWNSQDNQRSYYLEVLACNGISAMNKNVYYRMLSPKGTILPNRILVTGLWSKDGKCPKIEVVNSVPNLTQFSNATDNFEAQGIIKSPPQDSQATTSQPK